MRQLQLLANIQNKKLPKKSIKNSKFNNFCMSTGHLVDLNLDKILPPVSTKTSKSEFLSSDQCLLFLVPAIGLKRRWEIFNECQLFLQFLSEE